MRNWTPEAKAKQSMIIRQWQPWKKGGVKTPEGKAISCMNSLKHGGRTKEVREAMKEITLHLKNLRKYSRGEK
jgi:hypothetical protein